LALFFTLLACVAASVPAQEGPLAGHEVVVQVTLPDRAAVDALTQAGFIVDDVRDNVAVVYLTEKDLPRLEALGYSYVEVPRTVQEPPTATPKALGVYHDYAALTTDLEAYAVAHTDICRLYTLGQSNQGRELWAMLITDNPDDEEDEPEFKYVSTMHGDEPLGTELCLYLIEWLLSDYGVDARITDIVDETAIWIVPLMNPDGLELGRRSNSAGFDLNRTFPEYPADYTGNMFDGEPLHDGDCPTEAGHVMRWTADNSFVLSANIHTGALLVNYPYDEDGVPSGSDAPTQDDLLFEEISLRYSENNPYLFENSFYLNGITNGSAWYAILGGMQDWNYRYASCNEVTLELSYTKKPPEGDLPDHWGYNAESMLVYLESVHMGVRGLVTSTAKAPLWAKVEVDGIDHPVFTDADVGDYHRMLLPGTYALTFSADGYEPQTVTDVEVVDGTVTRVDVVLEPGAVVGDVDGNGVVNSQDLQLVVNKVLNLEVAYDCDLNGDLAVDAVDIQIVVIAILEG